MSDSESNDSDEGIRYKTDSVRNKTKMIEPSRKRNKDDFNKDYLKQGHSRSHSPKKDSYKLSYKNPRRTRSSSENSGTSSSEDEIKSFKKKLKQEDKKHFKEKNHTFPNDDKPNPVKIHDQQEIIGPALPPHLLNKSKYVSQLEQHSSTTDNEYSCIGPKLPAFEKDKYIKSRKESENSCIGPQPLAASISKEIAGQQILKDTFGPQLPPSNGPQLPPHMCSSREHKNTKLEQVDDSSSKVFTNQSPPSSKLEKDTVKIIGPNLPPHLREKLQETSETTCLADIVDAEDEEDVYGPLPSGMSSSSLCHKALEERALQLKIDQLEPKESGEPVRETWMLELPAVKAANFGLGPRQFRNRSGPDLSDRSSWTDVPSDKDKKKIGVVPVDLRAEAETNELKKRDKEQEMLTKKHKRKEKSLLKMHKEKLEKEKKDEGPSERRPFSRDIDLQVNRFDDAQKKAIMKKAQLLDDRFSSGKSKYL